MERGWAERGDGLNEGDGASPSSSLGTCLPAGVRQPSRHLAPLDPTASLPCTVPFRSSVQSGGPLESRSDGSRRTGKGISIQGADRRPRETAADRPETEIDPRLGAGGPARGDLVGRGGEGSRAASASALASAAAAAACSQAQDQAGTVVRGPQKNSSDFMDVVQRRRVAEGEGGRRVLMESRRDAGDGGLFRGRARFDWSVPSSRLRGRVSAVVIG